MGTKFSMTGTEERKAGWLPQQVICDPMKWAAILAFVNTGGAVGIISERNVPCQCML